MFYFKLVLVKLPLILIIVPLLPTQYVLNLVVNIRPIENVLHESLHKLFTFQEYWICICFITFISFLEM